LQHVLRSAEWPLGINDPFLLEQLTQKCSELFRICEALERAVERELAALEQ
jgi:hypothetical protein